MRAFVLPMLLAGCAWEAETGHQGTAVGNPGKLELGVETPFGTTLDEARARVVRVELHPCRGSVVHIPVGEWLDLLDPTARRLSLPGGYWCGLDAVLSADGLVIVGHTDGGTGFDLTLDPGLIAVQGPFRVDGHTLLLRLTARDTLDGFEIDQIGGDVTLASDHPLTRTAAATFGLGELYDDIDENGQVDPGEERLDLPPPTDTGFPSAQGPAGGCGCGPGHAWPPGALIALMLLFARRRPAGNGTYRDTW